MRISAIVALAAWLSVLAALWGVYLGHALDWRAGLLVSGCVLIGTIAGGMGARYTPTGGGKP